MNSLLVFSASLTVVLSSVVPNLGNIQHKYDRLRTDVLLKRNQPATQDDVFDLIKQVLVMANMGISSEELAQAAHDVMTMLDKSGGSPVDPSDVRDLIEKTSTGIGSETAVAALFDDVVTYQGEKMAAALRLWDSLVDKAKEQQAAGQSTRVTLAAIRQTAQAVDTIVTYTVSLVSDLITITNPENGDKRRALQKRGWSVGVDVGYGSHSGGRVGVNVGFSF